MIMRTILRSHVSFSMILSTIVLIGVLQTLTGFAADLGCMPVPPAYFDRGLLRLEIIGDTWGMHPIRYTDWDEIGRYRGGSGVISVVQGERYRIRITNLTRRRLGLVVAVDGRNILTGESSYGRPSEGLYILPAYGEGEFTGWRTSLDEVRRFYFTDAADSYASNLGDNGRIGQITVTAFSEHENYPRPEPNVMFDREKASGRSESAAPRASGSGIAREQSLADKPGTGWGERDYSPVRATDFEPETVPAGRYFIRYEWAHQRPVRYDDLERHSYPPDGFCPSPQHGK
ncbi:MAG: hypothetical protein HQM09_16375 [Candidatus Riflebacteria bacterium]|nr:hypothetical protein [Candidatus Riflebacteria bacterium]